jgi:hypothetical protein
MTAILTQITKQPCLKTILNHLLLINGVVLVEKMERKLKLRKKIRWWRMGYLKFIGMNRRNQKL